MQLRIPYNSYLTISEIKSNYQLTYKECRAIIKAAELNEIDCKYDINAAIYARVSNNSAKDNLDRQMERLVDFTTKNGFTIKYEVKEIASGMNDSRHKLCKLLAKNDWDVLIVENKDRLTRFGFNYIELLLKTKGKEIIVVNETNKDTKEDLISDLVISKSL